MIVRRRPQHLDVATMVAVAAAFGSDAADVAGQADLTLLALVAERARLAATAAEAAAAMLVGVAAGRPFPERNSVAAWSLAVAAVESRGRRLEAAPGPAVELVRACAGGALDESEVLDRLAPWVVRRDRTRQLLHWLCSVPPAPGRVEWACPRCGRPVSVVPFRSSPCLRRPLPCDVVADCAVRWRAHPGGAQVPVVAVARYEPQIPAPAVAQLVERADQSSTTASARSTSARVTPSTNRTASR